MAVGLHAGPWQAALSTLFASGNFAVSIFFVVGAFVATRGLLRKVRTPPPVSGPVVEIVRR